MFKSLSQGLGYEPLVTLTPNSFVLAVSKSCYGYLATKSLFQKVVTIN